MPTNRAGAMRIVAATGNPGKLAEIRALLGSHGESRSGPPAWEVVAQSELGVGGIEESGVTFVENALLKARNACAQTGLAAVADDSGLEVDALGGAPGIHTARYAGAGASSADNIRKLLDNLGAVETAKRTARFRCILVYMRHAAEPSPLICTGVWEGRIAETPAGGNGFGYDPVFFLDALGKTAAQLDASLKNRLSHRAQAFGRLSALLRPLY